MAFSCSSPTTDTTSKVAHDSLRKHSLYRCAMPTFSRMRGEELLFLSGSLGGGPCSPRVSFHDCGRSRGAGCAVPL